MKKVLIKIFTFILALCCVGLVACNNTEQKPSATLVGFENSTVEISYGMNYNIADYVYDSEGNRYAVSASVTDNDGNAVEADGFFQVLKASYKVVYSVEFGGENKTSTVTVKGISTPVIEFADIKEQTYTIGILPAELPAITASDVIDGTITSITKEVYKQTSFENKKMEDYDGFSNYYMPKELGTYFWKVTVTNSNGQSNTRLLYFYVTSDPGEYDLLFDEDYVNQFKCAKDLTYDYVTNSEIPTEGIINEIGYNGHAYKIGNVPHNADITVPFGYTAKEYIALEQRGMFNAVQFYYMIDSTRHPSRTQCGNNDQRLPDNLTESFNGNWSFFSSAGYYAIKKNAESSAIQKEGRYIKTNEWQVATVPVSDFVKCLGTGKTAQFIRTFMYGSSDTVDIYLSDVKFIDYDWTKVPNKGAYDLKINETNFSRVTVSGQGATVEYVANADFPTEYNWKDTVKDEDGDVIKDTVLDEFGNPVLDANGNPTTKNRLVEVIGNVKNNVGYAGNAAKVYIPTNNKWVYVNFNYTGNEYLRLEQEGKFNAVKFTVMSESGLNNNDVNLMAQAGFAKKTLIKGEWKTYILSIEDFVKAFEDPNTTKATLYRSYLTNGFEHDFYVGDFEFITYDFNHEHTGGTATCSSKAICEICFQEYGDTLPHTEKTPATCTVKAVCDVCGESYGELAAHTEKVEEEGTLPSGTTAGVSDRIVCELCGTLISEKEDIPALNFNATAENLEKVSDTRTAHVAKEFVENSAIATEGIANPINFAGDAFKMTLNHNVCTTVTLPYTGTELARLADKGAFNAIKFSYMIDPSVDIESITNSKSADNFFLLAGYNGQGGTRLIQNKWVTHVIPAANILDAYADPDTNVLRFFYTYTKVGGNNDWFDFYFSGIEFITIDLEHTCAGGEATCVQKAICSTCGQEYGELTAHVGGTATCEELAICTVCGEGYGELAPHTEKVEIEGTAPTATETGTSAKVVCEVCEEVLSEQETIPALNYVPVAGDIAETEDSTFGNVDVPSKTTVEFFAAGSLPTEMTYGEGQSVAIDNSFGYAGPAIRIQTASSGRGATLAMPYTGEQYKAYMEENGYTAVKVWMALGEVGGTLSSPAGSMIKVFGTERNKWVPVYLTVDQFVGTFGYRYKGEGASDASSFQADPTYNTIVYRANAYSAGITWALHIGTMEFVEYDFDHAHTGGTATCEKLAVCSICYQPYGELAAHTEGTPASCIAQAVCDVCGESYGELAPHTENVEIEGTKPTGTTAGLSDKLSCLVCNQVIQEQEVLPAYDFIVSNDALALVSSNKTNATFEYVTNANFPANFYNNVGYTGDAILVTAPSNQTNIKVTMPYNAEGYKAVAQLVGANAVKFTYLNATGSMSSSLGLFVSGGSYTKAWTTAVMDIDTFVSNFEGTDNVLTIRKAAWNNAYTFYIGNIELIKVADGEVVEHGAYGFTASEETLINVLDTATSIDYEKSFVANANLPTDGVDNTIGFTGDAVKVSAVPHNATFQIQMAYSADEYTALAAQGKFNAVKFSFMVKTAGDISSLKNNLATNMIGVAGYGRQTKSIEQNTWVTVTISVEDFVGSFDGSNRYQLFKSYIEVGATETFDFYFSDIEFVTI